MAICAPAMAKITRLESCNSADIEALLDAAFGVDRHARTAYLLRAGMAMIEPLSFGLLEDDGALIGSIQCWPVQVADGDLASPLILVGPVAVHPDVQSRGHGHMLMQAMLSAANEMGDPAMMMIGDEEYYGRFGFIAAQTGGWRLPGPWEPHRLLCRNPENHPLPKAGDVGPRDGSAETGI